MGKLVLTSTTNIALANNMTTPLSARVTTDAASATIPFETVSALSVPPRAGTHGAEIPATTFKLVALAEVKDSTSAWTPYLDYYGAAPTPTTGGSTSVSLRTRTEPLVAVWSAVTFGALLAASSEGEDAGFGTLSNTKALKAGGVITLRTDCGGAARPGKAGPCLTAAAGPAAPLPSAAA